jgi:hypothetical protein
MIGGGGGMIGGGGGMIGGGGGMIRARGRAQGSSQQPIQCKRREDNESEGEEGGGGRWEWRAMDCG